MGVIQDLSYNSNVEQNRMRALDGRGIEMTEKVNVSQLWSKVLVGELRAGIEGSVERYNTRRREQRQPKQPIMSRRNGGA